MGCCAETRPGYDYRRSRDAAKRQVEAFLDEWVDGKGRRERNKEEKLRRIKAAAIELFKTRGYDDTTTREIATRAGVALGTVFLYAETKRDLLFLIVNDDLEKCIGEARRALKPRLSLFDSLLMVLRIHYAYFARTPVVSRAALREMYFYESGKQAERFIRTRESLRNLLLDLVTRAMDDRLIHSIEPADCVTDTVFAIYQVHLRRWLAADVQDLDEGMSQLGRQLRVVMHGLSPRPEALGSR
jgi:AcrR family transcriptional regulator